MNKSTLALAMAAGVLAQQASAAGFVEDSKATLACATSTSTPITVTVLVRTKTKNGAKASICVSSPVTPRAPSVSVSMRSACWV